MRTCAFTVFAGRLTFLLIATMASLDANHAVSAQTGEQADEPTKVQDAACELPALRDELAERVRQDQRARMAMIQSQQASSTATPAARSELLKEVTRIDQENTAWLKQQIEQHGWPGKSLVGTAGAHNAWLLVQHADRQPAFQKKCLKLMNEMPAGEVSGTDIAYLTDRVLVAQGKPQRFGTQCTLVDGKAVVKDVEDRENLNRRRAEVGLDPIEDYLKMVEKMYASSGEQGEQENSDKEPDPQPDR